MTRPAWRLVIVGCCLLAAAVMGARAAQPHSAALPTPLLYIPKTIEHWTGHDAPAFAPDVLAALGVDDYINRVYVASDVPVSLYVGYYESQQTGDTMHSPQNCLPGAGWLPVTTSRVTVPVDARADPVTINRLLIQKGLDRQVVLYWYQSHGRVVASEYWSKVFLVSDAIRLNRSDAAMVRVVSPVLPGDTDASDAERRALSFIQSAFPHIDRLLPL